MSLISQAARKFRHDQRGNFAVIFAVVALPVMAIAGLGLDYARISAAEEKLQASVDGAILAAAANSGNVASMQHAVNDFIAANLPEPDIAVKTVVDTYKMTVEASYELPTSVLAAAGIPQAEISASAQLTSRSPLRNSGGVSNAQMSRKELRAARRKFERAIARLPRTYRDRMLERFDQMAKSANTASAAKPYYLSE
ncbi:MAG: TadE/TadG family type IV pilus assembly protein [Rhizobiaceae bacterium]